MMAVVLLVAGCAVQPTRESLPELTPAQRAEAEAAQARRAAQLHGVTRWSLSGRMAIAKGRRGGSGRLDWEELGPDGYEVTVSAPVSRQSWRLVGSHAGFARLEGIEGGAREGDAERLLREAVGWEIPVDRLRDWLRALPATAEQANVKPASSQAAVERDPANDGSLEVAFGPDGRLREIRQHGWTIDYQDWHPAIGDVPELPRRIEARSGDASVRLIVDEWRL